MQNNKNVRLRIIISIIALLILFSPVFSQSKTAIKAEEQVTIEQIQLLETPKTVQEMIDEVAPRFGQDPALIGKISWCESHHKIKSHDNGRAVNVTGIHDKTFMGWLPLYEKEQHETLDIKSTYDQLKMMSWAFSKGESYRRQWTSYVAYLNGGTYTFYSKLLGGTYTSRCK